MPAATTRMARVHPTLPIFRVDGGRDVVFYTPGSIHHVGADEASAIERAMATAGDGSAVVPRVRALLDGANAADAAWRELATKPFAPECLTVYLSNRCNLGCGYCYAAPPQPAAAARRLRLVRGDEADAAFPLTSEETIAAAAQVVAAHCRAKSKPLTLVLHGGGEPTLHWDLLTRIRERVDAIAAEHGLGTWAYIATHGALPERQVEWLARRFSLIGLSCDGPPDIQNANRPFANGGETATLVERAASILRRLRTPFVIRATITRASVARQADIVDYAWALGASAVRFEPAYDGRHTAAARFAATDAARFVDGFLAAKARAARLGCDLALSGVRPGEIHGPYCNPLRDVLHVTPDGAATACFLSTGSGSADESVMALGRMGEGRSSFVVDYERAALLRQQAARVPARCEQCVNVYHCARDCPDVCVVTAAPDDEREPGFRCRVQQLLTLHWLTSGEETIDV